MSFVGLRVVFAARRAALKCGILKVKQAYFTDSDCYIFRRRFDLDCIILEVIINNDINKFPHSIIIEGNNPCANHYLYLFIIIPEN